MYCTGFVNTLLTSTTHPINDRQDLVTIRPTLLFQKGFGSPSFYQTSFIAKQPTLFSASKPKSTHVSEAFTTHCVAGNVTELSVSEASQKAKIEAGEWKFRGQKIAYTYTGLENYNSPTIVCVHGFGANSGHFRKTLAGLGSKYRIYAIDLLGFGASGKPLPNTPHPPYPDSQRLGYKQCSSEDVAQYTYEFWSAQLEYFVREVVERPVFLVANSIGCVVCMQAIVNGIERRNVEKACADTSAGTGAATPRSWFEGLVSLAPSLRLLTVNKRSWLQNITAPTTMKVLKIRPIGEFFFNTLATPNVLRKVLATAYYDRRAITDELVDILLTPARDKNALDVFLAFISYDTGPVPEDLLPHIDIPNIIVWGDKDNLEPIRLGRKLGEHSTVEEFITLNDVGHCPMCEREDLINPIIDTFITKHRQS